MNKLEQFETYVYELNPDIIGVTESWTSSCILDSELSVDGYDLFRQDRPVNHNGGGVLLYVKSSLCAVQCSLSVKFPEQVWCYLLDSKGHRLYIGVCYRSPSDNIFGSGNHDLLQGIVNELGSTRKHFVLMGDCNYRYLSWPPLLHDHCNLVEASQFYHCIEDNFFTQHVDFCTRRDAILDLVITDEPNMVYNMLDLGPFLGSDHNALSWQLEINTQVESPRRRIFDYNKGDIAALKCELNKIDWNVILHQLNAEESWNVFKAKIECLEEKYVPTKIVGTKRKKPLWMSRKALKAVQKRRQVYKKYKDVNHPAYTQANKNARLMIKKARKDFEKKLAKDIKADRKSFFAYARSKCKSKVKVGLIEDSQGKLQEDSRVKAELLNDFFSSVFTREDDSDIPVLNPMSEVKLQDIDVHVDIIKKKLTILKEDKAAGDDNLSPSILKGISDEVAYPVAVIFRRSLDTGCVPRDWRTANITPIFKKGSRHHAGNYRPVSLTSQISKVVESIIRDELVQHLNNNNLIRNSQHGFRKGYSCTTNMLEFLETVTAEIDAKHNLDTVYLDLAKAFDKVPHQRLILKLKAHGIDGLVGNWIKSWLSDRWQRVCLDGTYSHWTHVWSGVPQGSVLGPVLFLIFINDLDISISSNVLKFADDTKLYRVVDNEQDGHMLQRDLDVLCKWAETWKMSFNVDKCKVLHYGKGNIECKYSMCGHELVKVESEKDLGIIFSKNLKVSVQCNEAYSKANRMLGLISRTIKYRNVESLSSLYKSLVRPHLDYCSSVWNPYLIKDKFLLERVQHRFTRMFPDLRKLPYEQRLSHLRLWTLEERRSRADLIEVYKMIKGISATPWSFFFSRAEGNTTRGHNWKLQKKQCRTDTRLRFFSQRTVNRWNSLSQKDIDATTLNSFKSRLERRRNQEMDFFKD